MKIFVNQICKKFEKFPTYDIKTLLWWYKILSVNFPILFFVSNIANGVYSYKNGNKGCTFN